jgi:hypothetical protein
MRYNINIKSFFVFLSSKSGLSATRKGLYNYETDAIEWEDGFVWDKSKTEFFQNKKRERRRRRLAEAAQGAGTDAADASTDII